MKVYLEMINDEADDKARQERRAWFEKYYPGIFDEAPPVGQAPTPGEPEDEQ